jgi:hypothetical protein
MKTIKARGKTAHLDLEDITPAQGAALAESLGRVLISRGGIRDGAILTGPHLLQFAEELIEHG